MYIDLGVPQIIFLVFYAINLFSSAYLHGKPQTGKYNFFVALVSTTLGILILAWGGFFS